MLWLATTDGQITTTIPSEPNHAVFIGHVTRSQNQNGRILYAIQNGYELNELHGVLVSSPTDEQVLMYDYSTGLWKNKTFYKDVNTDTTTTAGTIYIGIAAAGSSTSANAWYITKIVSGSGGAVTTTHSAVNVKWTDRTTTSYS